MNPSGNTATNVARTIPYRILLEKEFVIGTISEGSGEGIVGSINDII